VRYFLKFQPPNTITTHFLSFKTITRFSFYFLFFSHLPKLIIIFLLKKLVGTSIQDWIENYVQEKKKLPMILIRLLRRRRKEVKVDPKLGGQWKVPCLVANGMFQAWWPMESKRKNTFSPLPIFPQQILLKPSIFSFDLTVLFYHGSRPLLLPFFPFPRSINYDCTTQCNKSFTPSLSIWFWLKI